MSNWLEVIKQGDPIIQARAALAEGMDAAVRVDDGFPLVHRLLFERNPEQYIGVVKLLLERADDIELVDNYGWSVLAMVSFHGDKLLELTRWLLERGADPLARQSPRSPLFRVLDGRKPFYSQGEDPANTQSFELLVHTAGPAALELQDRHGRTLLQLARCRGDHMACEVIHDCQRWWKSQAMRENLLSLTRGRGALGTLGATMAQVNPLM